jgi:hypothetical protein
VRTPTEPTRPYATGAWLDFVTVTLWVDAARLRDVIAPFPDLAIAPVPEAPAGLHPVCIDLSRVRDGRPEPGGVDQHTWSDLWGTGLGAMAGFWGAWLGPAGYAWSTAWGAATGRRVAREVSQAASRALGTYNEAMAFVPNVVTVRGGGPYLFALGMHTDSAISKRLAEVYRSGFGKRLAIIERRGFEAYAVRSPTGEALATASFAPPARLVPAREVAEIAPVLGWLAQPVLGHVGGGVLAVSHVDRFYDDPGVGVAPVTGRLAIAVGFAPGVPAGAWAIGEDPTATAFQATYVPVELDFPVPLGRDAAR